MLEDCACPPPHQIAFQRLHSQILAAAEAAAAAVAAGMGAGAGTAGTGA